MHRFSCFTIRDGREIKIAQAAIGISHQHRVFAEGLQLVPEAQSMWRAVMSALLARLGSAVYHYGSPWSLEPPRDSDLAAVLGVTPVAASAVSVFAVDFARWPSWEAYLKEVSTNAKRNAKKGQQLANLSVASTRGWRSLKHVGQLLGLRGQLSARKSITFYKAKAWFRLWARIVTMPSKSATTVAYVDGHPIAAINITECATKTYLMDAASIESNRGTSWLLTLQALHDAYQRASNGHFVLGFYRAGMPIDPGLVRFREQCCATEYVVSEIVFMYGESRFAAPQKNSGPRRESLTGVA